MTTGTHKLERTRYFDGAVSRFKSKLLLAKLMFNVPSVFNTATLPLGWESHSCSPNLPQLLRGLQDCKVRQYTYDDASMSHSRLAGNVDDIWRR